jgi:leucyl-tRNA synthetase
MRGTVEVGVDAPEADALAAGLELNTVRKFTDGKEIKKVIYVAGKILNVIVGK